MIDLGNVMFNS